MGHVAEREGLTRAILALALRARYARPKSLLRFCRTPFSISRVRTPALLPSRPTDSDRGELMGHVAEREGFEPSKGF